MTRQTVRADDGTLYVLEKRSRNTSRVRNPQTGERTHIPNDQLTVVDGESPLVTAAQGVPEPVRTLVTAVPHERALGLLIELETTDGMSVRQILAEYDLCESDLHGLLAELQIAGLIQETRVTGERGYETTETATEALDHVY